MSQLFMVQLSSTFEIIIIWVSAIISLGLMTLSLGLRALEASKITICPTNVQITSILTLIFNISVVYGQIGLCFGDDTSAIISLGLMTLPKGLGGPRALKITIYP